MEGPIDTASLTPRTPSNPRPCSLSAMDQPSMRTCQLLASAMQPLNDLLLVGRYHLVLSD
uniref:WGS project CBMG000000000 data, contig CS5907-c000587 n=1 Tax=Fusarium acuminatum CS5907 TaxID=1318461 RepID=A0A096PE30_9HYPO|nr:unnamed protein product [Fusarium acuminatum CS5907]